MEFLEPPTWADALAVKPEVLSPAIVEFFAG